MPARWGTAVPKPGWCSALPRGLGLQTELLVNHAHASGCLTAPLNVQPQQDKFRPDVSSFSCTSGWGRSPGRADQGRAPAGSPRAAGATSRGLQLRQHPFLAPGPGSRVPTADGDAQHLWACTVKSRTQTCRRSAPGRWRCGCCSQRCQWWASRRRRCPASGRF